MVSTIRSEHERRYPGINSRWLAYCYAMDRHPTCGPCGPQGGVVWLSARYKRAAAELGICHCAKSACARMAKLKDPAVTEKIWRYALEERDAKVLD